MTEEPDVYKRRRMMKNFAEGNPTKEDIEFMMQDSEQDRYGELETISKDAADGRRLDADYHGETRQYYVPSDGAWMSGNGFRLDKAYRVFEENDNTMTVREVEHPSEKQAIIQGYMQEIRRILDKSEEQE
ncbi:hypothetical protein KY338_02040 [Candidatus Woesearchaeota archaeon]|nr:hypothetical protein [Candidatus Woesearchaeota archaeon]MBW3005942.1 hypothetical protein [Candidatus Woesearchaeota archaeon]